MSYPDHSLTMLVRKLVSHSVLDDDDRAAILNLPVRRRTLDQHGYLIREGDPPEFCALLCDGFAYRQKTTAEGARQIVGLHVPGDPLDLQNLFLDVADHSIQALTRVEFALIPRVELRQLAAERVALGRAIMLDALIEASILREWLLNIGRRDSRSRTAHLLCEFAVRLETMGLADRYGYELPMTQEQLGDALGLTPVHVNRTLKALESDGLISRDKRFINFPDWHRLREAADFNQRYLHLGLNGGTTSA